MIPRFLQPLFGRKESAPAGAEEDHAAEAGHAANGAQRSAHAALGHGVKPLPRPALRWVGPAGRVALREMDYGSDVEAVCAFQEETYSLNFPDFRYTDSFAGAFRHDLRRASLDNNHGLFVLDDREVIGFLWLLICENTWTGERYGYVNNLYISPARRDEGLGGELMRQADTFFRRRGIHRVRLTVTATNLAATTLYEHCGYHVTRWEMEKEL